MGISVLKLYLFGFFRIPSDGFGYSLGWSISQMALRSAKEMLSPSMNLRELRKSCSNSLSVCSSCLLARFTWNTQNTKIRWILQKRISITYRIIGGPSLLQIGHQPFLLEIFGGGHAHVGLLPGQVLIDAAATEMATWIPVLRHQFLASQVPEDGHVLGQLIAVICDRRQLAEPVHVVPELASQVLAWNGQRKGKGANR